MILNEKAKRQEKELIEAKGIDAVFAKLGNLKEYQKIFKERRRQIDG
jgi:hypothetical protein